MEKGEVVNVKIRPLNYETDMEAVYRLYGAVFGKDSLESWRKRWQWEYLENPGTEYSEANLWVAEREDGVFIGIHGSVPGQLKIDKKIIITHDPCDFAVHQEARRQGLGKKLVKAFIDSTKYIALAYNGAGATGRICRRLGLVEVDCVPWYYRPYNLRQIFYFMLALGRLPSWICKKPLVYFFVFGCNVFNCALTLINHLKSPQKSLKYTVEEVKEVGAEFDRLWKEISFQFPILFVRDATFIKWRFIEDPGNKHTLLVARDKAGKLRGYIAILVSNISGMMVGRIMDIFCPPENVELIDFLLANALNISKQRGVALLSCMGLHPVIRNRVQRYLYYKPRKNGPLALLNWKGDKNMKSFVENSENWHLSHADGDVLYFDQIPFLL